jgi:hypothetical protein
MSDLKIDQLDRVGKRVKMRDQIFTMLCENAGAEREILGMEFDSKLFDLANSLTGEICNRLEEALKARRMKVGHGADNWKVVR